MPKLSIYSFLPKVKEYLNQTHIRSISGWSPKAPFDVRPLAQGEYNMNFIVRQRDSTWVLRINTGSQLGLADQEQIAYEYNTLVLLQPADVAPIPYFLDNSFQVIPFGVLGMSFIPGETLDYHRDLAQAAQLMARYHQLQLPDETIHLIREGRPLSFIFERGVRKLEVLLSSDLAHPDLCTYFKEVIDWADQARHQESFFIRDPWQCIINSEVNNTNWIVDRKTDSIHLVDWEKPMWGDPSQDLSHFRVPTTTLWKTDIRLTAQDQAEMMRAYQSALQDRHLRDTIEERTRLRDPFNCLRGVSWCAMTWVNYQSDQHRLKNQATWRKLSMYVDLKFVRSLFDPYLHPEKVIGSKPIIP
jgi:aminoglycoside phosphotransferase (APT) family kinase protein